MIQIDHNIPLPPRTRLNLGALLPGQSLIITARQRQSADEVRRRYPNFKVECLRLNDDSYRITITRIDAFPNLKSSPEIKLGIMGILKSRNRSYPAHVVHINPTVVRYYWLHSDRLAVLDEENQSITDDYRFIPTFDHPLQRTQNPIPNYTLPLQDMTPGDSILLVQGKSHKDLVHQWQTRNAPDWRFEVHKTPEGYRCWRVT